MRSSQRHIALSAARVWLLSMMLGWIYLNQHNGDGHHLEVGNPTLLTNWRMVAGPRGQTASRVTYCKGAFGRLARTDEWKRDPGQNVFADIFMCGEKSRRFIKAEYDSFRVVLFKHGKARR